MSTAGNQVDRFVRSAWRERWSVMKFCINLNSIRQEVDADKGKRLAALLMRYATMDEYGIEWIFQYMENCVATGVISSIALFEVIVSYDQLSKSSCLKYVLNLATHCANASGLRIDGEEDSAQLSIAMLKLFGWLLGIFRYSMERSVESKLPTMVSGCVLTLAKSGFVKGLVKLAAYEDPELFSTVTSLNSHLLQVAQSHENADLRLLIVKSLELIQHLLLAPLVEVSPKIVSDKSHWPSMMVSISIVFANTQHMTGIEDMVRAVLMSREIQDLRWTDIVRDLLHGAFLLIHDDTSILPPSVANSFLYLRLPRVLQKLCQAETPHDSLIGGLKGLAGIRSLLDASDLKARCNTLQFFLNVLVDMDMINEQEKAAIMQIRFESRAGVMEHYSPDSQPTINLVLKAEPTLLSILKVLNEENLQMPERLSQMLNPLMSGKGLLYIVAAASSTDQMALFAEKLIRINEHYRAASLVDNGGGEIFDLSFLLLHRLSQYHSTKFWLRPSDPFLQMWYFKSANQLVRGIHTQEDVDTLARLRDYDYMQIDETYSRLKRGHTAWMMVRTWDFVLSQIAPIGERIVHSVRKNSITSEELKHILTGLLRINVNGVQCMCGPLLCLAQYLALRGDEVAKMIAEKVSAFLDSAASIEMDRSKHITDRISFMANSARRFLMSFVAAEEQPLPPFNWFGIGRMLAKQFPTVSEDHFPLLSKPENIPYLLANSLRVGCVASALVSRVIVCTELGQYDVWISSLIEALHRICTPWGLRTWCDLSIALCFVDPSECAPRLVAYLDSSFPLTHRDLFCVGPRGCPLAFFLVQLYIIALRYTSPSMVATICKDTPRSADDLSRLNETTVVTLRRLYSRLDVCRGGALYPTANFVGAFLNQLACHSLPEAQIMKREIPLDMVMFVLWADPHLLKPETIVNLYNPQEQTQRHKIMHLFCVLHKVGML
uniref:Mediator of RNA polymerase II transcription subunit 24 n=1 Tax=Trichuris muris TaxID=70415 RepID=A0A5S6Q709_TRIMR